MSMGVMDMRASLQARASLENDVRNLKVAVDSKDMSHVEPESKVWAFVGHQGRRVLVDRRNPEPPPMDNARYCASSYKVGYRSTEINPVSGTHSYDTGNLYRTVHWRPVGQGFGLNGYFTNDLARAGMCTVLRLRALRGTAHPDDEHEVSDAREQMLVTLHSPGGHAFHGARHGETRGAYS